MPFASVDQVERFTAIDDRLFAVLANGALVAAPLAALQWEIDHMIGASFFILDAHGFHIPVYCEATLHCGSAYSFFISNCLTNA